MASYRSSVASQLAQAEQRVRTFVYRTLIDGGRRFRARMVRERLSGPPGVDRVTGRLKRSLRYKVAQSERMVVINAAIGGVGAKHARALEDGGLLEFGRVFREEAARMLDAIRVGLKFLGGRA